MGHGARWERAGPALKSEPLPGQPLGVPGAALRWNRGCQVLKVKMPLQGGLAVGDSTSGVRFTESASGADPGLTV